MYVPLFVLLFVNVMLKYSSRDGNKKMQKSFLEKQEEGISKCTRQFFLKNTVKIMIQNLNFIVFCHL
jgi:hypothetical protein